MQTECVWLADVLGGDRRCRLCGSPVQCCQVRLSRGRKHLNSLQGEIGAAPVPNGPCLFGPTRASQATVLVAKQRVGVLAQSCVPHLAGYPHCSRVLAPGPSPQPHRSVSMVLNHQRYELVISFLHHTIRQQYILVCQTRCK